MGIIKDIQGNFKELQQTFTDRETLKKKTIEFTNKSIETGQNKLKEAVNKKRATVSPQKNEKWYQNKKNASFSVDPYFRYYESTNEFAIFKLSSLTQKPVGLEVFNLNDIDRYEVIENENNSNSFGVGRAVGGALLTGGIGLLAGFTKTKKKISDLRIRVYIHNNQVGFKDIVGVKSEMKTSSILFKNIVSNFEEIIGFLEANIMKKQEMADTQTNNNGVIDDLERISSLKEKGFLTQEEFDIEKQKLLQK